MLSRHLRNAATTLKSAGPKGLFVGGVSKLLGPVLSPEAYKSLIMFLGLGYWPNIRNPRSFNEKVAHRQVFAPHPLAPIVSDKWRVRQYVAERGLGDILNEVYFVTDDPAKIPFDDLPDRFVIKANHGRGWNIIVRDKSLLDRQGVIRQCREWLSQKYGLLTHNYETHYDGIAPKILVERFIDEDGHKLPLDYKFFCFHGRVQYVDVIDRSGSLTLNIYNREWQDAEFSMAHPKGARVPKPARFDKMVEVAESLADGFDFVRVDLYTPDPQTVLFGEITMSPTGGLAKFTPREWDFQLGKLW